MFIVNLTMGEHLVGEDLSNGLRGTPPLVPVLAESYEVSADGLEYTFHLRRGVTFHDGTPFNSEAVEFNIRRQWDQDFEFYLPAASQIAFWNYQYLQDIQTPDEYTVKLVLSKPWGEFLRMTCQSWGQQLMISPEYVKKVGNDAVGEAPVMTGPFRFVERVPGERIVVERNPDYWGAAPRLAKIIFRPMPDVATRVAAIVAGEIDICDQSIPWDAKADLEAAHILISTCDAPYMRYMPLNHKDPIIGIKDVRVAINMAIDKEGLCKGLYGDWAAPAASMLPANSPAYDPRFDGYPYDPDGARALLAEAGFPDGISCQIMIVESQEAEAVWIQRNLRDAGIDLAIEKLDMATFGGKWAAGLESPNGMAMAGWGMTADYWIDLVTRSTRWPPKGANNGWYANPDVDTLLDQGEMETDPETRKGIYRQVAQILHDDAAFVPLFNLKMPLGLAPYVRGFVRPDQLWYQLSTVYLEPWRA